MSLASDASTHQEQNQGALNTTSNVDTKNQEPTDELETTKLRRSTRLAAVERERREAAEKAPKPEIVVKKRKCTKTQMEKAHPAPRGVNTAGRGWNSILDEPSKWNEFSRDSVANFRSLFHPGGDPEEPHIQQRAYLPSARTAPPNAPAFKEAEESGQRKTVFTANQRGANILMQSAVKAMITAAVEADPDIDAASLEPKMPAKRRKR